MMSQSMPFEKWQGHKEDEKLSLGQHQELLCRKLVDIWHYLCPQT
jgi:hypothetical protein